MSVVKEEFIEDENVVQQEISQETSSEADKSLPIPTHRKKVEGIKIFFIFLYLIVFCFNSFLGTYLKTFFY